MGGHLALRAAGEARAGAVVAICPASTGTLRRGLERGSLGFEADVPALSELLDSGELQEVVKSLEVPILLLHARGDERVPVQHSRELAKTLRSGSSRLIEVPGGHHRSVQHDEELQAVSLRFCRASSRGADQPPKQLADAGADLRDRIAGAVRRALSVAPVLPPTAEPAAAPVEDTTWPAVLLTLPTAPPAVPVGAVTVTGGLVGVVTVMPPDEPPDEPLPPDELPPPEPEPLPPPAAGAPPGADPPPPVEPLPDP